VPGPQYYNEIKGYPGKGEFVWRILPYKQPYRVAQPPTPPYGVCKGVQYRSGSNGKWTPGQANTTVTLPTGVQATDVLICLCGAQAAPGGETFTAPAGWTAIFTGDHLDNGTTDSTVLYGFWALGNVANLTFTQSAPATSSAFWNCLAFTGVNNTTPIDATGTITKSLVVTPATVTANSVTTVTDNALEIIAATLDAVANPFSNSNFTTIDNFTSVNPPNTLDGLYANTAKTPPGSTGTFGISQSGDSGGANQAIILQPFALRPAS
jgi:hypothetical protein